MPLRALTLALAGAGLMTACGGGDSASPPAPVTPSALTLTGVVAKSAAIGGASVQAKCASGTAAPATSGSDGRYTLNVDGGALPCVLKARYTEGGSTVALHSVATGSGASTTAHITPVTELLVAQLTGQEPAAYMAGVQASALGAAVTPAAVGAAQTAVIGTLSAAGVDTAALASTDMVSGPLVAATGSTAGNAYDQVLDALGAAVTSAGTSLAALTTTVAATAAAPASGASSAAPAPAADTGALPPALLLKPKAANCPSLASGDYRMVAFGRSATTGVNDTVTALDVARLDATTLTLTWADGSSAVWTPNGTCRYTQATENGQADLVVSPAGVIVARTPDVGHNEGTYRLAVGFPVQAIGVADLAGMWNLLGWQGTPSIGFAGTVTVAGDGKLTASRCFDQGLAAAESTCITDTQLLPAFTAHSAGGFDLTSTDPSDVWKDRVFAYRAGTGELMLVGVNAAGEFWFATRMRTLGLPAVGEVSTLWNLDVNAANVANNAVAVNRHTILAVGSATGTFTRRTQAGTAADAVSHPQSLANNNARNGYTHRSGGTVTASDGSATAVREMYSLKLNGMGLTPYVLPNSNTGGASNARFGVSVKQ